MVYLVRSIRCLVRGLDAILLVSSGFNIVELALSSGSNGLLVLRLHAVRHGKLGIQ